nr:hypothetical protein [Gemmata massiliana]
MRATEPSRHAPDGPAQYFRGLGVRVTFEVAQNHGQSVMLRELGEFLVNGRRELVSFQTIAERGAGSDRFIEIGFYHRSVPGS